jgi:hypothetical protein
MAKFSEEQMIDAPIPGQGLTGKLGNYPWQQPPQLGIPLTTMANALQISGVMQGKHTIDVGMLVIPVIMETLAYVGDMFDVEYDMGTELDKDETPSRGAIALALKKVKKKMEGMDLEKAKMEREQEEPVEEPMPEEETGEPVMIGLMARRV